MPKLSDLTPDTRASILSIQGPTTVVQRLAEMGLYEGETLQVLNLAPLGDPMEIMVGNTRLTLRLQEARSIDVEILPT
ncbi:MAG: FeoA family protein [Fimbriiglobus sp.]